jgi:hypothetical protein
MNKKIIASVLAVAFAVSMVSSASAVTVEELQAQITQLLAQITGLQAQITAGQTTMTGLCLSANLSLGMSSDEVQALQQGLNQDPATQVAVSGAGAPGYETAYFGPLTKAAVIKFQDKYASEVLASWGLTKGTGYAGSTTRAKFNALYCTPVTTTTTIVGATEGTLTVTQYAIPGSGTVTLYGDNVQKEVAAYKMKATNSDIRVKRVQLQVGIGTPNDFPWRDLTAISIWDGSTMLKEVVASQSNFTEVTFGTTYMMTLDGLDVLIAKDAEKILSVKVTAVSVPQYIGNISFIIPANGVRGIDSAALNVYGPATALTAHNFAVALAQAPTITTTASIDSPLAGNFIASLTTITRVDLMKINVKVDAVDMTFKGGTITVDTNGNTTLSAVELYDGSNLLASAATTTTGTVTLSTFTLPVSANTTKVLTVKGVIKNAPTAGSGVAVSLPATTGLTGIDASGAARGNTGAITGNALTVYTAAPVFSLASASVAKSASSTTTTDNVGDFTIGISITANSGDIYIPTTAHTTNGSAAALGTAKGILPTVSAGGGTQTATSSNWSCDGNAVEDTTNLVWRIPSGATSVCTYNYHVLNTTTAGWYNVSVLSIKWATNADMVTGLITQSTGISALKAPATLLNL